MAVDPAEMLEDIKNADGVSGGVTLSEWEAEFVDSIDDWLNKGRTLTPKQGETLEKIWDRI